MNFEFAAKQFFAEYANIKMIIDNNDIVETPIGTSVTVSQVTSLTIHDA